MLILCVWTISIILLALYVYFYEDSITLSEMLSGIILAPGLLFLMLLYKLQAKIISSINFDKIIWRKK
jgi:hypothetical protein